MKNDSTKFQLLKLSIKEVGCQLFNYVQYVVCILRVNLGGKCLEETHEWQKDA